MTINKKRNIPSSTIYIDYLQNTFTSSEIESMEKTLSDENLTLRTKSHEPKPILGIEELFAQISIYLSPDIVALICQNIITRGTYDCLKAFIIKAYKFIRNKPFAKIKNGEFTENAIPYVHLVVGNNKIILPMNMEQDKFEYALDTFRKVVTYETVKTEHVSKYNEQTQSFECYKKSEFATKIAREGLKKQGETDETTI